jgi:hypothetical protein
MSGRHNLRSALGRRDESLLRYDILGIKGQMPLARICKPHVQKWITVLEEKGNSPRTTQESYRILAGIMAEAVDHKLIPESPCRRISLPRTERVEQRFLFPPGSGAAGPHLPPVRLGKRRERQDVVGCVGTRVAASGKRPWSYQRRTRRG